MNHFTLATLVLASLSIFPPILSSSFGGIGTFGGYGGIGNIGIGNFGGAGAAGTQSKSSNTNTPRFPSPFESINTLGGGIGGNILKPISAIAKSNKLKPAAPTDTGIVNSSPPATTSKNNPLIQAPGLGSVGDSPGAVSGIIGPEGTGNFSGFGVVKGIIGPNADPVEKAFLKQKYDADQFWSLKNEGRENFNQITPKINSNRPNSFDSPLRLCREMLPDGREAYIRC